MGSWLSGKKNKYKQVDKLDKVKNTAEKQASDNAYIY